MAEAEEGAEAAVKGGDVGMNGEEKPPSKRACRSLFGPARSQLFFFGPFFGRAFSGTYPGAMVWNKMASRVTSTARRK